MVAFCRTFSRVACCGLDCSCNAFALVAAAVGFTIACFCDALFAVTAERRDKVSVEATALAREPPSGLLRCAIGRFAGVLGGKSNSSSEGTSNTSRPAVAASAFAESRGLLPSTWGSADASLEVTACLCDRSGVGASSLGRLGRGGGRRESLPYVMTFLRLSPVVEVDDM